jgi:hypothetical protein
MHFVCENDLLTITPDGKTWFNDGGRSKNDIPFPFEK